MVFEQINGFVNEIFLCYFSLRPKELFGFLGEGLWIMIKNQIREKNKPSGLTEVFVKQDELY